MHPGTILLIALGGALLARWFLAGGGPGRAQAAALLPAGLFGALLAHLPAVLAEGSLAWPWAWAPSLGVTLTFRLDALTLLFALIVTGIGTLVVLYSAAYFRSAAPGTRSRFVTLILLFQAAMLGTVLIDDLVGIYVFWEWTSLISFMLIGFDTSVREARAAALQSLLVTAAGGLALLAGILLLGQDLGTFSLADIASRPADLAAAPRLPAILVLLLLGAFTKSAQAPFHFWLPRAMQAPTPASAYLHSATMVKLGVVLLARLAPGFAEVAAFGTALLTVGLVTALLGSVNLFRVSGYKAVLAHSTVASLGLMMLLIGLGSPLGTTAAVVFLVAHALYKAALFFVAGSVTHHTGESSLSELAGLRSSLPLTAVAAGLAALSMAGVPPLFGFVAKELVLEAQLAAAPHWLALVAAVFVSAALVAAAYLTGVKPFVGAARRPGADEAPLEKRGFAFPPLLLAAAGALLGLLGGWPLQGLLAAAAGVAAGGSVDLSLSLWHGLTPALALSAAALALGALLAWRWRGLSRLLERWRPPAWSVAERGYERVVSGVLGAATWSTRTLQNGDQRRYTLVVAAFLLLASGFAFLRTGVWRAPVATGAFSPLPLIILALMVAGALVALRAPSLVTTLLGVGVVGYGSALIYLLNGAPDLALTQFAIETLVLVVMMAVLLRLPLRATRTRTDRERRVDGAAALLFGAVVFVGLVGMLSHDFNPKISEFYGAASYLEAFGRNVVNVIIVDFRGLDTVGEISVVGFATLSVWALLRRRRKRSGGAS